jgi:hypothetical protein
MPEPTVTVRMKEDGRLRRFGGAAASCLEAFSIFAMRRTFMLVGPDFAASAPETR